MMLELGADINASNHDGTTAMHGAAFSGANDVVKFLADKGRPAGGYEGQVRSDASEQSRRRP